jgi:uncharacterized membrane-anchored protein YhcB (DUF1043 family)
MLSETKVELGHSSIADRIDSNKVMNVDLQSQLDLADVNLATLRAESLAQIDRLQSDLSNALNLDIEKVRAELSKSFRHFLLEREQERMPFLQRVMTSHIENMEDERGFPPRHPVHWFKSKLEFSSTGVLEFDLKQDAEAFMESALSYIESNIKSQLTLEQQATIAHVDRQIRSLQQHLATQLQPVAKARKIISAEYVNGYLQTGRMNLKAVDRFYFVSMGVRFDAKKESIYSEVCVRPTGLFDRTKDGEKPTQLKYAISCDRLLDVVNESIARSIGQIQQQSSAYLTDELIPQIDNLFQGLAEGG